jgi:hypothetical protein
MIAAGFSLRLITRYFLLRGKIGSIIMLGKTMDTDSATITALDYSQRFRVSWAIIWPHLVFLGALGVIIFIIFVPAIKDKQSSIFSFIFPLIFMLGPPLFITPWAVRRAVLKSYHGFHLQVERTNDQTKRLTHIEWMAPAWLWLWRNWIIILLLSPLTKVGALAGIPALVSFFIVSPWVVGKMIGKKYATTLYFSIHPNSPQKL